jgi:hypothetical protein
MTTNANVPVPSNGSDTATKPTTVPASRKNKKTAVNLSMFDDESLLNDFDSHGEPVSEPPDPLTIYKRRAIHKLRQDQQMQMALHSDSGVAWGKLIGFLTKNLPDMLEDRQEVAHQMIPDTLNEILGPRPEGWHGFQGAKKSGGTTTYVKAGPKPGDDNV